MKRDGVGRLVEVLDLIIYDAADVCVLGVWAESRGRNIEGRKE